MFPSDAEMGFLGVEDNGSILPLTGNLSPAVMVGVE